jgi:tRNA (adenine57-N1/adenine58-N1)-methyltransferase
MNKVLMSKEKQEYVESIGRAVVIAKPRYYYVRSGSFNCGEGEIKKLKNGKVKTNKGKEFFCFDSTFKDDFGQIKRLAQIITPKDIGIIITECGLNKDSVVVEGGSGSGALACFLAKIVKKVYSYDINETHQGTAKKNAELLKIENIAFKLADMNKKISEQCDAVILDLPQPWDALNSAEKAVKVGGFIVAYSPAITQVMNFVEAVEKKEKLLYLKTIELIERRWKVKGGAVRPVSEGIGHTAFLVFVRKIN